MHFDATIHLGDLITLGSFGWIAWQRVAATLRRVDEFMRDSAEDRLSLHRRLDLVEARLHARHKDAL
jgi:hypothetical protein